MLSVWNLWKMLNNVPLEIMNNDPCVIQGGPYYPVFEFEVKRFVEGLREFIK